MTKLLPQPTVPGKAKGIIAVDPMVLQCGVCGETTTHVGRHNVGTFIILAGWLFCRLEEGDGPRRCRDCLAEHAAECWRCAS